MGIYMFMDLLNDLLNHAGLRSKLLGTRSFDKMVALQFPCSKSIGFHVVTLGQAFLHQGKGKVIALNKGDIALMARGCYHIMSTSEKLPAKITPIAEFDKLRSKHSKPHLSLVSGVYQFWNAPVHPFFAEMPEWFVLRYDEIESFDKLQLMIGLLSEEVSKPDLGSDRVVQGILDVMFSLIMRKIVKQNSSKAKTWSHASQDIDIKHALEILHSDVAKNWSLEELAKLVGLSRAGFALKFKRTMGDSPLHYLTMLRIQSAMQLLSTTDMKIENVALQVGYQDAFGFSKAFKKIAGIPPRDFRARDLSERQTHKRL